MVTDRLFKLPLVLDPQPEVGWTITRSILPGLVTEADTVGEILTNVADAIEAYKELSEPIPEILRRVQTSVPFMADTLII